MLAFESFAYLNLGYQTICGSWDRQRSSIMTPEGVETVSEPGKEMKICSFLWVYYGYPSSTYEGSQRGAKCVITAALRWQSGMQDHDASG